MYSDKIELPARIDWITGLKGLACFGVFVHHYFGSFTPSLYKGGSGGWISWLLSSSPIGVLLNGNFFLFIFIVLSSYLVSKPILNCDEANLRSRIGTTIVRRYFRLMLPILGYGCVRHLFVTVLQCLFGHTFQLLPYPSFWYVIKHCVYETFSRQDSSITGPLWMMHHLFVGSYIVLLLALPNRKTSGKWMIFIYAAAFFITGYACDNYYLAASVAGILIADLLPFLSRLLDNKRMKWLPPLFILIGLFLGGVPSFSVPNPAFCYRFATLAPEVYHAVGAFLLILGLFGEYILSRKQCKSKPVHEKIPVRFLQTKPLQQLGSISYSVYLIHEAVIIMMITPLNNLFMSMLSLPTFLTACIELVIMSFVTILISALFYFGIEKRTNSLCQKIRL